MELHLPLNLAVINLDIFEVYGMKTYCGPNIRMVQFFRVLDGPFRSIDLRTGHYDTDSRIKRSFYHLVAIILKCIKIHMAMGVYKFWFKLCHKLIIPLGTMTPLSLI